MRRIHIVYIFENLDWKSCSVITGVPNFGDTPMDIIDRDEIDYIDDMLILTRGKNRTCLDIRSIVAIKLYDKNRNEIMSPMGVKI